MESRRIRVAGVDVLDSFREIAYRNDAFYRIVVVEQRLEDGHHRPRVFLVNNDLPSVGSGVKADVGDGDQIEVFRFHGTFCIPGMAQSIAIDLLD